MTGEHITLRDALIAERDRMKAAYDEQKPGAFQSMCALDRVLEAVPQDLPQPTYANGIEDAAKLALTHSGILALAQGHEDAEGQADRWYDGGKYASRFLADAIRTLPKGTSL